MKLRSTVLGFFLLAAFVMGCVASALVVPRATAVQTDKWEYFCFSDGGDDDVMEKANKAGAEGWEMVAGSSYGNSYPTWCFKRAK